MGTPAEHGRTAIASAGNSERSTAKSRANGRHAERSAAAGSTKSKDLNSRLRCVAFTAASLVLLAHATYAQQVGPRTDALLARAEHGDAQARRDVETLGWDFIKLVAEKGRLDPVTARTMARTMLLLASPLPPIETPPTDKERVWRSAAVNALEMALAQDSGDVWSASQFARIAPYPYLWMNPDQELVALRALLAQHPDLPSNLLLTRVRLELERGSADSAATWLASLPAGAISGAGRGHITAEAAFARRKDADGAAAYYEGASAIRDSADAAWYTRDLAWIAQPDELTEWHALAPAAREAWLEKFWNRRDIDDGQLPGTRLPEQFRRWRVALRDYRWEYDGSTAKGIIIPRSDGVEYNLIDGPKGDIPFPKDATVSGLVYLNRMRPLTLILDDRGGLVLRHGNPTQRANLPGVNSMQEETLSWATPAGPLVVSFSRMADSLPPVPGFPTAIMPSQRFGMVARNYPAGDLIANCETDPRLCILAGKWVADPGGPSTLAFANTILRDFTRMRTEAERTDGNPDTFKNDLRATVQAYGIPDLGTLVVFAIPAKGLIPDAKLRTSSTMYAARLRVVAGDSARGEFAATLDTVRNWSLKTPPGDSTQLTGFLLVPTPPGTWSVAVVLSDLARQAGTGQRIGSVPVVGFDGKTLRLGDPILGSPASGLTWTHDGDQIPLNPRNAWRPDELAILNYQVDGLVVGRGYETHIEVWETAGNPKTFKTSIGFTNPATAARMSLQRELSLRELTSGDYRIVLRVRDTVTGTEVIRDRRLAVRK
jgi:hypothetical protein